MPLGMEVGLGPVHIVLDGDTATLLKRGAEPLPQFSAHLYCGQTAGCIKMPLGTEVGLGLRDIVFDVDPAWIKTQSFKIQTSATIAYDMIENI